MPMKIPLSSVCDRIYAASALATLSKDTRTALLHPDHGEALRLIVRDTVAALAASVPKELISDCVVGDDCVEIVPADTGSDNDAVRSAFITASASLVLAQVRIAASESPDTISRLASTISSLSCGLTQALSPKASFASITPCRF